MSEQAEPTFAETIAALCAPTLGTVAGTMIVEHLPTRLGVRREVVTIGTAAAGVVIALNSQGAVRAAAISMAAQAAAHELLKQANAFLAAPSKEEPQISTGTTEAAFITRADLEGAIAKMHEDQRKAIVEAIRAVMTELGPVIAAAQQPKRNATPLRRVQPFPARPVYQVQDEESWSEVEVPPTEVQSQEQEPTADLPEPMTENATASEPTEMTAPPTIEEKAQRIHAVYSGLSESERQQLSSVIATLPKHDADRLVEQLSILPVEQAVDFVRCALPTALKRGAA